jgi:glycerol-3-phosphate acyltransferase PlsY
MPVYLIPVLFVAAYLIGGIPFGFLVGKAKGVDIRTVGSRNIGATNVGRVFGKGYFVLVFLLDVAKGLVPVLAGGIILERLAGGRLEGNLLDGAKIAIALGAILGHVFSPYLGFKGGKGVATSLGVVLGIWPYYTIAGLSSLGVWILALAVWRYVSLGSILAAATFPIWFIVIVMVSGLRISQAAVLLLFACIVPILVIYRHRSNISRLIAGTESKFWAEKL